jgi:hypothetical protein
MVLNLLNELETVKAFLASGLESTARVAQAESVELSQSEQPNDEFVEFVLARPDGAFALEQILFRSVIHELNSLYEFAIQQAYMQLSDGEILRPNKSVAQGGESAFVASRKTIENALKNEKFVGDCVTDVTDWPHWAEVLKIKEMSEGFKHRHRLQPFPAYCYADRNSKRSVRLVDPNNSADEHVIADYEVTQARVSGYIKAIEELLLWLSSKNLLSRW